MKLKHWVIRSGICMYALAVWCLWNSWGNSVIIFYRWWGKCAPSGWSKGVIVLGLWGHISALDIVPTMMWTIRRFWTLLQLKTLATRYMTFHTYLHRKSHDMLTFSLSWQADTQLILRICLTLQKEPAGVWRGEAVIQHQIQMQVTNRPAVQQKQGLLWCLLSFKFLFKET